MERGRGDRSDQKTKAGSGGGLAGAREGPVALSPRCERIRLMVAGWVIIGMGLFIAVTAVWSPSLLLPIMRERRVEAHGAQTLGYFGPPVMGAAFAFGF